MEKINFATKPIKKQTRYDLVASIALRLNDPIGKWLGLTKGISHKDLDSIVRSAESMSIDSEIPFPVAFNWHWRKMFREIAEML